MERVVSLVPSMTETLIAWGVTPLACTRFCEQPSLTHVGGTKDPDIDAIVALRPGIVLMDREENRRDDAEALQERGVEVFSTHVASVSDVAAMTDTVRARLGLTPLVAGVEPAPVAASTTAFVAIWRRPWMTCNAATYGSSLLASFGVANVYADATDAYPTVDLADVAARAPQLVLLPSEPYPFAARHVAEIHDAMPAARVVLIDGQDLFWWGWRTPAAARRLAQLLSSNGL